jgi:hypothetical protein
MTLHIRVITSATHNCHRTQCLSVGVAEALQHALGLMDRLVAPMRMTPCLGHTGAASKSSNCSSAVSTGLQHQS